MLPGMSVYRNECLIDRVLFEDILVEFHLCVRQRIDELEFLKGGVVAILILKYS